MRAFYENRKYSDFLPVAVIQGSSFDFLAHWHPDVEIVYVYEGSLLMGINQEQRLLQQGNLAVCASNAIHYYSKTDSSSKIGLLIFRPDFMRDDYCPKPFELESLFLQCSESDEVSLISMLNRIKGIFDTLFHESKNRDESSPLFIKSLLIELFGLLLRNLPDYAEKSRNKRQVEQYKMEPMQKALHFLENNYSHSITLEQLAEKVNLSKFYLSRLFKATTNMNFNEYLNRIRVDKAEKMIHSSRKQIIEIALETGFSSVRTFNRVFKTINGYPPSSIRSHQ